MSNPKLTAKIIIATVVFYAALTYFLSLIKGVPMVG